MKASHVGGGKSVGSADSVPLQLPHTAVAAHELKTPLALIRQLALELQRGDLSQREIGDIHHQIQLVSERSLRLTTDMTKAHNLQTELFTLEPLHAQRLCDDVRRELQPLFRAKQRTLTVKAARNLPLMFGSYDLLRRVLLNFTDNALHYSDPEGIVTLYMQLRRRDHTVRLAVRDHGPALPAAVWCAMKLQTHSTGYTSGRPESSGLGLQIACEFAAASNARVGAIRHRDGASFYVDVPLSKQLSFL